MTRTGWMGESPDAEGPAMPLTARLLASREHRAGVLETALARSRAADAREAREQAAGAVDPDERAAGYVSRGYRPGLMQELTGRLGDTMAELEAEQSKLDKAQRRAERVRRAHENGQIRAWDVPAALGDEGDAQRCEQLERRAASIRRQIAEAQDMISPPQLRDLDPVEQATRRAHETFRELTRQRMAEAQQSRPQAPPPFASRAAAGAADAEHTGPDCRVCAAARERDAARAREDAVAVYGEAYR